MWPKKAAAEGSVSNGDVGSVSNGDVSITFSEEVYENPAFRDRKSRRRRQESEENVWSAGNECVWISLHDPVSQKEYYYNTQTGVYRWDRPKDLK